MEIERGLGKNPLYLKKLGLSVMIDDLSEGEIWAGNIGTIL